MKLPVIDPEEFAIRQYNLSQYISAYERYTSLIEEREEFYKDLYEDASPRITAIDEQTGLAYTMGANTEMTALRIIDEKARYEAMINKEQRKAETFQLALDSLDARERDVILVHYYGRENDLGLSAGYYTETLRNAQNKLCDILERKAIERLALQKEREREQLKALIHADKPKVEILRIPC